MTATKATAGTVVPITDVEPVEQPATNVIEALRRVMRDLPAIAKTDRASGDQGGYLYRGIESITMHAQVLLARHGVLFVPSVESWDRDPVTVGQNKTWHDERLRVTYTVYGPGGVNDSIVVGPFAAIGRDGSDKGCNKAMTQAFKYALLQVFCISDKADDADGTTVEADYDAPPAREPEPEPTIDEATQAHIRGIIEAADDPEAVKLAWVEAGLPRLERLPERWLEQALRLVGGAPDE